MTEAVSTEEQQTEFSRRMKLIARVLETFQKGIVYSLTGTPLSKFSYPSDKRLNANVTKSLQEAEHNFDAFWKEVDDQFIRNDGESLHALLANILPHRDIQRTPDWVEPREGVVNRGSRTKDLSAQAAMLELEARTEKTVDP